MTLPLAHLKVLDLTRLLPGGYCTLLFADMGADVLKIEEPGKGDYMRWMPPMAGDVSAGHLALNRGKRSMTLNLKHADGQAVLKRLVRDADVLVEGFRPGVMDRLGVGYEALQIENPMLVYCAITGYGQDGPYKDRAGHDINYLGYAGVLDIIGERGGAPVDPGVQIADVGGGGLMAAVGILAALHRRDHEGVGSFVDISMMDGAMSWLCFHAQSYAITGQMPKRGEMRLSGELACYHVYRCGDGRYVTVGALEPQFWRALCEALGVPDMIETHLAPPEKQDEMIARLDAIFSEHSRDEWVAKLSSLEACFGPVNDMEEAFANEQVRARGMVARVPVNGAELDAVANPIVTDGSRGAPLRPPPGFGTHTDDTLRGAGYPDADIASLRERGVV